MGYISHYFLYWKGMEVFLYESKNIYVLNLLATVCVIPLLLLCRYRTYLSIVLTAVMIRYGWFENWAKKYFDELSTTDFEMKLRRAASIWFVTEFLFSFLLIFFTFLLGVGSEESLYQAMQDADLPYIWPYYYWALNILTIYFSVLILVNAIRDYNTPDYQTLNLLSERQKRELIKGYKPSKFDPF